MDKVIRYKKNGIVVCGTEKLANKEDEFELCNQCTKRNKELNIKDCYTYSKIRDLAIMFSVTIPVFSCLSFQGEITEPVVEKDSCEE